MASFNELVNEIDSNITNQRDRGTAFEKLSVAYLTNEPAFKNKYSNVWMLNEVPEKYHISKQDTGVDIVAQDRATGELTAVQAKYYKGKVGKDTINSFIAEMGKDYYHDGLIITSTDDWNKNAKKATDELSKNVSIIGLSQLQNANFDWQFFDFNSRNEHLQSKTKRLRDYQKEAINKSLAYFKDHDRGKLIMAPGTGKTFTSLKIAEALMNDGHKNVFNVLYLVPSIQLLTQTLFNWNSDKSDGINMISFSVVSDRKATKKKQGDDDLSAKDIGFPATTSVDELMSNYHEADTHGAKTMTVVFSTYQSIDVTSKAQQQGYPEFDLIIADEAHRTTGASQMGDASVFTKVHKNSVVKSKLRLYQTATPKVYGTEAKKKAETNSIKISSMDDPNVYGDVIFRLGFGEAVNRGYLTDYKVSVLAVDESYVNKNMQNVMSSDTNELHTSDIGKIIGVWNAMVKRNGIQGAKGAILGAPMKRAIAFTDRIDHSKQIANEFNDVINDYLGVEADESFTVDVHHVDGTLNALQKKDELDWLAGDVPDNTARLLSNVRFLTEGIDVPNLDAIIFMSPKKSQVDIVQAVGRIMRLYEGKEYGYIILPIVIDANTDPAIALDNNQRYQEVWQVLNALRSVDERFEAEINKLELNKKKDGKINIVGVNTSPSHPVTEDGGSQNTESGEEPTTYQTSLNIESMGEIEQAFYGKIVQKVGDRRYLEDWSADVARIAQRHITKIEDLIKTQVGARNAFNVFIKGLRYNINDSIDEEQAIEMLAQHLITQPIFKALFDEYSFVNDNPVSKAMNDVVSAFSLFGFDKEQKELEPFYESVKLRASGIDNAEAKQKIIVTLYDKFFRTGFKKTTEQMGIVFTPVEVVDFIIKSVDWALKKYLGRSLADEDVHILDPFTGTGTFITRTLQYFNQLMGAGVITYEDILRKYMHELHANEIVLLSYYIAAINIEAVFDEINGPDEGYVPFNGIVLTDTFDSTEEQPTLDDKLFGANNARLKEQQKEPITVIIGNPPYNKINSTANTNIKKTIYPGLEKSIQRTYASNTNAGLKNSLSDSYIKAFRWASDRIGNKGIIGFITNNGYLDSASLNGVRKSMTNEFNRIFIVNLKGAVQGLSKEEIKNQGKNIFDIKTGVAIIFLVKDRTEKHELEYCDIGNDLSRKNKLDWLSKNTISSAKFERIHIDINGDWLNHRDSNYEKYFSFNNKDTKHIFLERTIGFNTNRDYWAFNFSKKVVENNISRMIQNYNNEVKNCDNLDEINLDEHYISWSDGLKRKFDKHQYLQFDKRKIIQTIARPFVKKYVYYDKNLVERPGRFDKIMDRNSVVLFTPGVGGAKTWSMLVGRGPINLQGMGYASKTQTYPLMLKATGGDLAHFDNDWNLTEESLNHFGMNEQEFIQYVYGVNHSKEYQKKYKTELLKEYPHMPLLKDSGAYIEVGKQLMDLHINYEEVPVYPDVKITASDDPSYVVKKMKFGKKLDLETNRKVNDRSKIIFNSDITVENIPERAYEYIVNGRSAIEWIMDQYQIKTDKKSGITDDPNDFSDDPKYIFNLLLRIINVSVQTVDLVNSLPKLEIIE